MGIYISVTLHAEVRLRGCMALTSMSVEALSAVLFCGAVAGAADVLVPGHWRVVPVSCGGAFLSRACMHSLRMV